MAKLTSSLGIKPCVAGQPVPIGTAIPWDKNIPIPDGYLDCSTPGITIDINKYQEYYERFKTNTLPYYPPTSTHRMIIKLKEYAVGEVINADSLAGRHWSDYQLRENVLGGLKNYIINGNFDIWQRGTSQTTASYGSDDRWFNYHTASSKTHSQQAFTLGQTEVPGNPKYFSRTVVTSANTVGSMVFKLQAIEDVTKLAGKTVTATFWAKADTNRFISFELMQVLTPSTDIVQGINTTKFALTTSWQKFTKTVTLPSALGKTVNSGNYTGFRFWFDAGSNYNSITASLGNQSGTFDIAQVQLEGGDKATPFEQRHIQQELSLCQRYFETGAAFIIGNGYVAGAYIGNTINFNVTKRTNPTITFDAPAEIINIDQTYVWPSQSGFRYHTWVVAVGSAYITRTFYADAEL